MLIAFSGPSGIGKGFVKQELFARFPHLEEVRWMTTRALRPGERGGNRVSISRGDFARLADSGELVLVQELYGNGYGVRKADILPCARKRIVEIHPDNIEPALCINPALIAVGFLTADTSLLFERLSVRSAAGSSAEIAERLRAAEREIETMRRLSRLYHAIIDVTKDNEASVFERVLHVLNPILSTGGRHA